MFVLRIYIPFYSIPFHSNTASVAKKYSLNDKKCTS
jgi:hypothetical protein